MKTNRCFAWNVLLVSFGCFLFTIHSSSGMFGGEFDQTKADEAAGLKAQQQAEQQEKARAATDPDNQSSNLQSADSSTSDRANLNNSGSREITPEETEQETLGQTIRVIARSYFPSSTQEEEDALVHEMTKKLLDHKIFCLSHNRNFTPDYAIFYATCSIAKKAGVPRPATVAEAVAAYHQRVASLSEAELAEFPLLAARLKEGTLFNSPSAAKQESPELATVTHLVAVASSLPAPLKAAAVPNQSLRSPTGTAVPVPPPQITPFGSADRPADEPKRPSVSSRESADSSSPPSTPPSKNESADSSPEYLKRLSTHSDGSTSGEETRSSDSSRHDSVVVGALITTELDQLQKEINKCWEAIKDGERIFIEESERVFATEASKAAAWARYPDAYYARKADIANDAEKYKKSLGDTLESYWRSYAELAQKRSKLKSSLSSSPYVSSKQEISFLNDLQQQLANAQQSLASWELAKTEQNKLTSQQLFNQRTAAVERTKKALDDFNRAHPNVGFGLLPRSQELRKQQSDLAATHNKALEDKAAYNYNNDLSNRYGVRYYESPELVAATQNISRLNQQIRELTARVSQVTQEISIHPEHRFLSAPIFEQRLSDYRKALEEIASFNGPDNIDPSCSKLKSKISSIRIYYENILRFGTSPRTREALANHEQEADALLRKEFFVKQRLLQIGLWMLAPEEQPIASRRLEEHNRTKSTAAWTAERRAAIKQEADDAYHGCSYVSSSSSSSFGSSVNYREEAAKRAWENGGSQRAFQTSANLIRQQQTAAYNSYQSTLYQGSLSTGNYYQPNYRAW